MCQNLTSIAVVIGQLNRSPVYFYNISHKIWQKKLCEKTRVVNHLWESNKSLTVVCKYQTSPVYPSEFGSKILHSYVHSAAVIPAVRLTCCPRAGVIKFTQISRQHGDNSMCILFTTSQYITHCCNNVNALCNFSWSLIIGQIRVGLQIKFKKNEYLEQHYFIRYSTL